MRFSRLQLIEMLAFMCYTENPEMSTRRTRRIPSHHLPEGETAIVRFRFVSDGYVSEEGWYVDDVSVTSMSAGDFAERCMIVLLKPGGDQAPAR